MEEEIAIHYVEGAQVTCNPFTVQICFTAAAAGPPADRPPRALVDLRMSPEHAKVFAIILRKRLRVFEEEQGAPIPVHQGLAQNLGISPQEDW